MRNVARLDNERERSVCTRTRTRTTVYRHVSPPPNRETICFQPDGPPSIFYFSIRPAVQLDSWLGPLTRGLDIFVSAPQRTESENTWSPRFSFSFFFFCFRLFSFVAVNSADQADCWRVAIVFRDIPCTRPVQPHLHYESSIQSNL